MFFFGLIKFMQKKAFRKETNLYLNFFTNSIILSTIVFLILSIFYAGYKIYQRGDLEESIFYSRTMLLIKFLFFFSPEKGRI